MIDPLFGDDVLKQDADLWTNYMRKMVGMRQPSDMCPCGQDTPYGCAKRPWSRCGLSDDTGNAILDGSRCRLCCEALSGVAPGYARYCDQCGGDHGEGQEGA